MLNLSNLHRSCHECRFSNFAYRHSCKNCSSQRPEKRGDGAADTGRRQPNTLGGHHASVAAMREPKPLNGSGYVPKSGDW